MADPLDREHRKAFYTPREVAAIARVDPKTVMTWIHRGQLNAIRLSPRVYRIPLAAVLVRLRPEEIRKPRVRRTGRIPTPGYKDQPPLRRRTRTVVGA